MQRDNANSRKEIKRSAKNSKTAPSQTKIQNREGREFKLFPLFFSEAQFHVKVVTVDVLKPLIVDYESACRLLLEQSRSESMDSFLGRLKRNQPPVPGQVTSILLALKVVFDTLKEETAIERSLAHSLFLISNEAKQLFEAGLKKSLDCPPLLNEDLDRIARSVKSILSGEWRV